MHTHTESHLPPGKEGKPAASNFAFLNILLSWGRINRRGGLLAAPFFWSPLSIPVKISSMFIPPAGRKARWGGGDQVKYLPSFSALPPPIELQPVYPKPLTTYLGLPRFALANCLPSVCLFILKKTLILKRRGLVYPPQKK